MFILQYISLALITAYLIDYESQKAMATHDVSWKQVVTAPLQNAQQQVSRVLGDDHINGFSVSQWEWNTLKNPHCLMVMAAKHT